MWMFLSTSNIAELRWKACHKSRGASLRIACSRIVWITSSAPGYLKLPLLVRKTAKYAMNSAFFSKDTHSSRPYAISFISRWRPKKLGSSRYSVYSTFESPMMNSFHFWNFIATCFSSQAESEQRFKESMLKTIISSFKVAGRTEIPGKLHLTNRIQVETVLIMAKRPSKLTKVFSEFVRRLTGL